MYIKDLKDCKTLGEAVILLEKYYPENFPDTIEKDELSEYVYGIVKTHLSKFLDNNSEVKL